jgi:glucose/mannose transport system permease protein
MADTVDAALIGAGAQPARRQQWERWLLGGIAGGLLVRLAMMLGLSSVFAGFGTAGLWVAEGLPWLGLTLAAGALFAIVSSLPGSISLFDNRLRRHVVGWTIVAVLLLILDFLGPQVEPALTAVLGRSGRILVNFCGQHGLFLAVVALLVAGALAAIGSGGQLKARPGTFERVWALNLTAKISAVPMMLVALGVFTGGTIWTVVYSFTDSRLLPRERWVGLQQYERLWGEERWLISIENLLIYGILSLVFSLVIGFILAALLDQKVRFENTFRTIFLYPFALSFIVTGLVWQWVLNPQFGIQSVVRSLGWESFAFDPLYNQDIVIYGILIAGLWQGTGLIMCLMLAGLRGIDEEIWKAARIDGIPMWKTYLFIVIPMMRPVFITTLVLIASGIVRLYDLVVAQTSGGPGIASEVPAKYVYDKMFLGQNLAQGFAASTMMLISVLIVLIPWAYLEFGGKKRG